MNMEKNSIHHKVCCATLLCPLIPLLSFWAATSLSIYYSGTPYFIAFCFITFQRFCSVCLTKWRFGNPVSNNFICAISSTAFAHFVSLSHFSHSWNISAFYYIYYGDLVISDPGCYYCKKIMTHWRLRWWFTFFIEIKYFFSNLVFN